ncbi:hypothetical protein EH220_04910 [bacterium]|nr:MAG: hypothetical protein EH220_04910 [bacterium]
MKFAHNLLICSLLALLLCFAVSCNDDDENNGHYAGNTNYSASEEFEYSFLPPYQTTSFILDAVSGQASIHFFPDAGLDSIVVSGERRVESDSQADADEHLGDLQVIFTKTTESLRFETEQPDQSEGRNYIVEYYIELPESMLLTVSQVNGPVWIHDMANSATASVVNGSLFISGSGHAIGSIVNGILHFESFEGSVTGSSVNGGITAEVVLPESGVCDLHVTNGNIGLEIPATTSAAFTATVVNGRIAYSNLTLGNATISPTSVVGLLGTGDGAINLSTTNGNIAVTGHD